MPQAAIQAVLFDAGNTLIYADPERLAGLLNRAGANADARAVQAAELEARRLLHDAIADGHTGTEPEVWHGYFASIFRRAGVPKGSMKLAGELLREVHADDHLWTYVVPGTGDTLTALADGGYRLGVISNADGRVESVLERVGLRGHFEFVVDSEVVGVEKPDPAIFEEGCRRMELPAEACLYVGDLLPVDYVGATAAGLAAVLIDPLRVYVDKAPRIDALADLPAFLQGHGR